MGRHRPICESEGALRDMGLRRAFWRPPSGRSRNCQCAIPLRSFKSSVRLLCELGIRLDYTEALEFVLRRLDDPSVVISRGFEAKIEVPGAAGDSLGSNRARASACGLKGGMK
jgi:hypothetical protein